MMGTSSSLSFQYSISPVKDMAGFCVCEIPATTHSQGQSLGLYSALQIHVDLHSSAPMI